jgi:hypothetical protein
MIKKTLIEYLEFLKTEVLRSPKDEIISGGRLIKEIKQQINGKRRSNKLYDDLTKVLSQIRSLV